MCVKALRPVKASSRCAPYVPPLVPFVGIGLACYAAGARTRRDKGRPGKPPEPAGRTGWCASGEPPEPAAPVGPNPDGPGRAGSGAPGDQSTNW